MVYIKWQFITLVSSHSRSACLIKPLFFCQFFHASKSLHLHGKKKTGMKPHLFSSVPQSFVSTAMQHKVMLQIINPEQEIQEQWRDLFIYFYYIHKKRHREIHYFASLLPLTQGWVGPTWCAKQSAAKVPYCSCFTQWFKPYSLAETTTFPVKSDDKISLQMPWNPGTWFLVEMLPHGTVIKSLTQCNSYTLVSLTWNHMLW